MRGGRHSTTASAPRGPLHVSVQLHPPRPVSSPICDVPSRRLAVARAEKHLGSASGSCVCSLGGHKGQRRLVEIQQISELVGWRFCCKE
eukprot:940369-Prymnesium_polylepis.2